MDLSKMSVEDLRAEITDDAEWGDCGHLAKVAYELARRLAEAEDTIGHAAERYAIFVASMYAPDGRTCSEIVRDWKRDAAAERINAAKEAPHD
jgi:hypothetical protein